MTKIRQITPANTDNAYHWFAKVTETAIYGAVCDACGWVEMLDACNAQHAKLIYEITCNCGRRECPDFYHHMLTGDRRGATYPFSPAGGGA